MLYLGYAQLSHYHNQLLFLKFVFLFVAIELYWLQVWASWKEYLLICSAYLIVVYFFVFGFFGVFFFLFFVCFFFFFLFFLYHKSVSCACAKIFPNAVSFFMSRLYVSFCLLGIWIILNSILTIPVEIACFKYQNYWYY